MKNLFKTYDDFLANERIEAALRGEHDSLDLSRLRMSDGLPQKIMEIPNLKHLSLSENSSDIPDWIADITSLESLDLSGVHSVSALLRKIFRLKNLKKLDLSWIGGAYIGLSRFPKNVIKLPSLEELNLSGAKFKVFPKEFCELKNLRSFRFVYFACNPEEMFDVLAELPNLKTLAICTDKEQYRDSLPASIQKLKQLEDLDLNYWSYLKEIPEEICTMSNLKSISVHPDVLEEGGISKLPDNLFCLPQLESFTISDSKKFKKMPASFSTHACLKKLRIGGTGIKKLPAFSQKLQSSLEELYFEGEFPDLRNCKNLKELSHSLKRNKDSHQLEKCHLVSLKELYLFGGNVDFSLIEQCINLEKLHLYNCVIENFSIDFSALHNLKFLKLENVSPLNIPASFWKMSNLKTLELNNVQITNIPSNFCNLSKLEILILDQVLIKKLPHSFARLKNLKHLTLRLYHNAIADSFYTFPNLEELVIGVIVKNQELPEGISRLCSLKSLVVSADGKVKLPADICNFSMLEHLHLENTTALPDNFIALCNLRSARLDRDATPDGFADLPKLSLLEWNNE